MLELVKNLLDVNQLEAGGIQLSIVTVDVLLIVEATCSQYRTAAEAKNIALHYQPHMPSAIVAVDEQAILQVLDNLISNAVKYSTQGKNIYVRVKASTDDLRGEVVRVEVSDEGPGLSDEDQSKLFGKFARLSAQPTGGEHSTGLGLSIVKKLVEAMNGRVWCESELGQGATFVVELPSAKE